MHGRHEAELLSGWWKPAGQAEQSSAFWFSEKRPDGHTTHVSSVLFRRFPALHSEHDALPLPAVRPGLQAVHVSAAGSSAKVFSLQMGQYA